MSDDYVAKQILGVPRLIKAGEALIDSNLTSTQAMLRSGQTEGFPTVDSTSPTVPYTVRVRSSDYPGIAGLTPKLRFGVSLTTNVIVAGRDITLGISGLLDTSGGASGNYNFNWNAAYAASLVFPSAELIANSVLPEKTVDVALPASGLYIVTAKRDASGALAAGTRITVQFRAEVFYS